MFGLLLLFTLVVTLVALYGIYLCIYLLMYFSDTSMESDVLSILIAGGMITLVLTISAALLWKSVIKTYRK